MYKTSVVTILLILNPFKVAVTMVVWCVFVFPNEFVWSIIFFQQT